MANHGIILPGLTMAKQIDSLNKVANCASDVDNGNVVVLGAVSTNRQEGEVYTATAPATATLTSDIFYIAYEPEVVIINGKYRGLTDDPREFVNIAGRKFGVFKPMVGDEIVLSVDAIGGTKGSNTFLAPVNGSFDLTWTADGSSASLALKYVSDYSIPVGNTRVQGYKFLVVKA